MPFKPYSDATPAGVIGLITGYKRRYNYRIDPDDPTRQARQRQRVEYVSFRISCDAYSALVDGLADANLTAATISDPDLAVADSIGGGTQIVGWGGTWEYQEVDMKFPSNGMCEITATFSKTDATWSPA